MSKHTTFRIGGPARFYLEVKSIVELKEAIEMARQKSLPWFVLGGGSNIMCSDKGYDGVVIQMANRDLIIDGDRLVAGAGAISVAVSRAAEAAGLSGLEWMISLPGTVGGAVRGNAGCFGSETKDVLESVRVLRDGVVIELQNADCAFAYRESIFKRNQDVIIDATFKLAPEEKEQIKAKMTEVLGKRKTTQPIAAGTAGCAFKNPLVNGTLTSCGKIVEELGLKGMKIGGISISDVHGNFLINDGTATADQVVQLIALVKTRARNEMGVQLQEEIHYLGF